MNTAAYQLESSGDTLLLLYRHPAGTRRAVATWEGATLGDGPSLSDVTAAATRDAAQARARRDLDRRLDARDAIARTVPPYRDPDEIPSASEVAP